ncbi:hypothetical protein C8039_16000 [Halogeometricum sp. wsp3]|nr:hypothetical protein C8039_16000 [Halogeometricum sp. wsp3]
MRWHKSTGGHWCTWPSTTTTDARFSNGTGRRCGSRFRRQPSRQCRKPSGRRRRAVRTGVAACHAGVASVLLP